MDRRDDHRAYGQLSIDADGVWTYMVDNTTPVIQALDTGESLTEVFTITSAKGPTTVTITINGAAEPPCFTCGTLIDTPQGPRPVEALRAGDLVLTRDRGAQPLIWVGSRRMVLAGKPKGSTLRPILIRADAIAPGVPERDLRVSPMHRILIEGPLVDLYFDAPGVLVAARHLVNGQSVVIDDTPEVEYVHLLFADHQIVGGEGLESESFYPGGVGLTAFESEARAEVLRLVPGLHADPGAYGPMARRVLRGHEARLLRTTPTGRSETEPPVARYAA